MAWITTVETDFRDERGRPIERYRVGWHETIRTGQTVRRNWCAARRPTTPARQPRTESMRSTPKSLAGCHRLGKRAAGNRPLSH